MECRSSLFQQCWQCWEVRMNWEHTHDLYPQGAGGLRAWWVKGKYIPTVIHILNLSSRHCTVQGSCSPSPAKPVPAWGVVREQRSRRQLAAGQLTLWAVRREDLELGQRNGRWSLGDRSPSLLPLKQALPPTLPPALLELMSQSSPTPHP